MRLAKIWVAFLSPTWCILLWSPPWDAFFALVVTLGHFSVCHESSGVYAKSRPENTLQEEGEGEKDGGEKEETQVRNYAARLPANLWSTQHYGHLRRVNDTRLHRLLAGRRVVFALTAEER